MNSPGSTRTAALVGSPGIYPLRIERSVEGTPQAPSGQVGTMTGSLRLNRIIRLSDGLSAAGVFTGELRDEDGQLIGVASRRRSAPVRIVGSTRGAVAVIGPVNVDLLGLDVHVRAATAHLPSAMRRRS